MDTLFSTEWVLFRIVFGVLFVALLFFAVKILFGKSLSRFWDGLFFGTIGTLGLAVAIDPDLIEQVVRLPNVRDIPLGRVVVLLVFAQLLWLMGTLILSQRLNSQNERFNALARVVSRKLGVLSEPIDSSKFKEIMVVLPAYHEQNNIAHVLQKIKSEIDGYSIGVMVVIDGIDDPTGDVVRSQFPNVVVVSQAIQMGSGAALNFGYELCSRHGVRIIVSMDADGQHDPDDLPNLVRPVLAGTHDVVIGNRLQGGWEVESVLRLVGLHIFGFIVRYILRTNAWDCSNNYRSFLLSPVLSLDLREVQYHTLELLFKAKRVGLRCGEAPVRVLARRSGVTKKGNAVIFGYQFLKKFILYGIYRK